eukprot:c17969_g1_i1 orf=466-1050(-)
MASLLLHAPGGVVCSQSPMDMRGLNMRPLNSAPTCKVGISSWAFQDKCELGFSSSAPQQARKLSWIAMSVSEEATTETQGGVFDVEDEAALEQYFRDAGEKLVVLDISTKTCGPCKMIYPKLVKMSKEYPDVLFLKIMGDLNSGTRALMRKWGVRAVPNFRFFRNGELIHSHSGANEDELRRHFLVHYEETAQV